jgi:Na+/H+-translocating membrane pyrophosphatase
MLKCSCFQQLGCRNTFASDRCASTIGAPPSVPSRVSGPVCSSVTSPRFVLLFSLSLSLSLSHTHTYHSQQYFTSHSYKPVREVSASCKTGAATNIIYGLALGYVSVIIPVLALAASIFLSLKLAGLYGNLKQNPVLYHIIIIIIIIIDHPHRNRVGIALAALGILSTLSIGLTIDAYGPISDNAGGIAEMGGLGDQVRERTDALDAAGNTTAAIGKGIVSHIVAIIAIAIRVYIYIDNGIVLSM